MGHTMVQLATGREPSLGETPSLLPGGPGQGGLFSFVSVKKRRRERVHLHRERQREEAIEQKQERD